MPESVLSNHKSNYGMINAYNMIMNNELIAIPVFQEHISPLLDEARRFALYEVCNSEIIQKIVINVDLETDAMRISKLKDMGVTTLISGAVSGYLSRFIVEKGLRHFPWVSGTVEEVIQQYLQGELIECFAGFRRCDGGRRKRCCITSNDDFLINNNINKEKKQ
ncbi:MAG TPA: NifB/NifX family molybdenum-iron cluster-binding protein [Spirochaetota bacterium]|nr:NifB/NifX family molybdenum-iron cluster-binding protein [Spirochaetota bacterium]HPR38854.1 NifB/NifX family molybdenum-iron cluster-binding protein [Spirochaetota bacterium]